MFIVLVGPSGVRKGSAMSPGLDILQDVGIKVSAQSIILQALIRLLKNTSYTQIDPLTGEMHFHSSLTIFSKEFTVFLGYQNKELMAHLCDWYDCDNHWVYETKNMGTDEIVGVWVNLIGATTPKLIQSSMPLDAIGGGLTSRMVMVYEPKKGGFSPLPTETDRELSLRSKLISELERINLLAGQFKFTDGWLNAWVDWRTTSEERPPKFPDDRFDGYIQRRPTHVIKLSMIMSASNRSDMVLKEQDLKRAISILESAEINMPLVFSGVGRSNIAELMPSLMAYISRKDEVSWD
jgi:hypothetical protein